MAELADAKRCALGHRADPTGLVLRGRARCRLGADHRPSLFRMTGGIERWLYRLVRKHRRTPATAGNSASAPAPNRAARPNLGFRLRPRVGRAAVARLRPGHRAAGWRRAADVPARAAHGTGIASVKPVDGLVLSGVPGIVLSGRGTIVLSGVSKRPQSNAGSGFRPPLTSLTKSSNWW